MMSSPSSIRHRSAGHWYCITLSAHDLAALAHERIRLVFNRARMAGRTSPDCAIWFEPTDEGGAHFFIPADIAAAETDFMTTSGARRCAPPRTTLQRFVGTRVTGPGPQSKGFGRVPRADRRAYVPTAYVHRSLRSLGGARKPPWHTLSPFVRRYIQAWAPPPPSPGWPVRKA